MSLDLTLLPYNEPDSGVINFSHTVLPLQTNSRDLMEKIQEISWKDNFPNAIDFIKDGLQAAGNVEEGFTAHVARDEDGESCYGEVSKDAYGEQMRWVRVAVLLQFKDHPQVERNPKNKAAWAYLSACDPNMRVALYWS